MGFLIFLHLNDNYLNTSSLSTSAETRWKCQIFNFFSGVRVRSKSFNGKTTKSIGDDIKFQRGKLQKNAYIYIYNIYIYIYINICIYIYQIDLKKPQKFVSKKPCEILIYLSMHVQGLTVEPNMQSIKGIMQIKSHLIKEVTIHLPLLNQTVVPLSPGIMLLRSCDIRNERICKTISVSQRSVSLHIVWDYNF